MRFDARLADGARLLAALVALSSVGCGGTSAATEAAATPAPPPPPAAAPQAEEQVDGEAEARIAAALRQMAEVRQLEPRGPVQARHLDARALVLEVERSLDRHVPPQVVTGTAEMLFGLGTTPPDFDYRASLLALMGTELAGLYDPERQLMLLRKDLREDALEATLLHELVHALQDQHYGLARLLKWRQDATDELSALSALAEGDATSAMLDALLADTGQLAYQLPGNLVEAQMRLMAGATHQESSVPGVLKRSLIAPYVDGLRFVHAVREREGWAGVDRAWRRPPVTTEQLLHFDKYAAAEPAVPVSLPPEPPTQGPWEAFFHDVWGEQSLRLIFEEWMPTRSAVRSATGWGGDRIVLYAAGARRAVLWHLIADTSADAERMQIAFLRGVFSSGWSPNPRPTPDVSEEDARERAQRGDVCAERSEAGPFLATRQGRSLVVIAGWFERLADGSVQSAATCTLASEWAARALPPKTAHTAR